MKKIQNYSLKFRLKKFNKNVGQCNFFIRFVADLKSSSRTIKIKRIFD